MTMPHEIDATAQVRSLHALLVHQLGLPSPLEEAVGVLDRITAVQLAQSAGVQRTREARQVMARQVALGERAFDEDALREWSSGSLWVADGGPPGTYQPAIGLAEDVARHAKSEAVRIFHARAPEIFGTVQTAARTEVGRLEALPKAPRGLFYAADPTTALVRAEGHEATLSVLAGVTDRFWTLQRIADVVRGPAGFGFERLPDGAPRLAYV